VRFAALAGACHSCALGWTRGVGAAGSAGMCPPTPTGKVWRALRCTAMSCRRCRASTCAASASRAASTAARAITGRSRTSNRTTMPRGRRTRAHCPLAHVRAGTLVPKCPLQAPRRQKTQAAWRVGWALGVTGSGWRTRPRCFASFGAGRPHQAAGRCAPAVSGARCAPASTRLRRAAQRATRRC